MTRSRSVPQRLVLPLLVITAACGSPTEPSELARTTLQAGPPGGIVEGPPAFSLGWEAVTGLPTAVRAATAASDGQRIYVFGGSQAGDLWSTLNQIYDPRTDSWEMGAPFQEERDFAMSEVLSDGVHLIAGRDAQFKMDHQLYDPRTDTWEFRAPLPIAIDAAAIERFGNRIYVIGGNDLNDPISTVHVYDPAKDEWTIGAPMPTARFSAASGVHRGRILIAGGQIAGRDVTNVLEAYFPGQDRWETLSPMPFDSEALGGGVVMRGGMVGHRFCVFGGRPTAGGGTVFSDTFCYDTVTDSWSEGPEMPTPRSEVAFAEHGGSVYAIGGRSLGTVHSAVERLTAVRDLGGAPPGR